MATTSTRVLLVSGSLRSGSTNSAALRTIFGLGLAGIEPDLYEGMRLLPHFDPDDDVVPLPPAVEDLRRRLGAADAVLFCTPEYAGSLPGSFKNLLDWSVGGGEVYEKPVAWVNVSASGGGAGAQATLAVVLGYCGTRIVADACRAVPVGRADVDGHGLVPDPAIRAGLAEVVRALVDEVARPRPDRDQGVTTSATETARPRPASVVTSGTPRPAASST
jgi:NAD(P)H-dependent FMN reductase